MKSTRHHTFRSRVPARFAARAILALGAGVLLAGCSTMDQIDQRIDNVLEDKSNRIGEDAYAPRIRASRESSAYEADLWEMNPPTTNPPADEIEYRGRDDTDSDSVQKRLDGYFAPEGRVLEIGLEDALRIAQESARDYLFAEEDYILSAIRLLIERHRWGPRFFDDLSVSVDGSDVDSSYTAAMNVINDLRVTQRLPYGGEVEARLVTSAARQLSNVVGESYTASNELVLSASVPLLRDAGMIAQESLVQAERDMVYAARSFERFRRSFLVRIADDYFALIAAQNALANAQRSLASRTQNADRRKALVDAGRSPGSDASLAEQDVLQQLDAVNAANDTLIILKDRFKITLGLPMDLDLRLRPVELLIPDPDIELTDAVRIALDYRLDYQTSRDRVLDSRRNVKNQQNQLLPFLDLDASASFPSDPDNQVDLGILDLDDANYNVSMRLGLPLDREIEKYNVRSAEIGLQRSIRARDRDHDQVILDVRAAVRRVSQARSSLNLQEESVRINERRLEELDLRRETVDEQFIIDAQDNLLASQNRLESAIRELRSAILDYLLVTGQMRVRFDGTFQPLQGMLIAPEAELGVPDRPQVP